MTFQVLPRVGFRGIQAFMVRLLYDEIRTKLMGFLEQNVFSVL